MRGRPCSSTPSSTPKNDVSTRCGAVVVAGGAAGVGNGVTVPGCCVAGVLAVGVVLAGALVSLEHPVSRARAAMDVRVRVMRSTPVMWLCRLCCPAA